MTCLDLFNKGRRKVLSHPTDKLCYVYVTELCDHLWLFVVKSSMTRSESSSQSKTALTVNYLCVCFLESISFLGAGG